MWGVGLALASALLYGVVDYAGGVLSRRVHYAVVAFVGQVGALVVAVVAALAFGAPEWRPVDLLWGALSGIGSAVTMLYLNRGISRGAVSVVVPVSAVTGVVLSVVAGVLLGDRPSALAWLGIVLVVPALWWVSGGRVDGRSTAVRDGLIASFGVAVQYVALGQADAGSGLWPVAVGRAAAVAVLAFPLLRRDTGSTGTGDHARAAVIGGGAALGLVLYLLAAQQELLTVAVVLASLYPVVPVLLGLRLLGETLSRRQAVGLVAAGVAVVLIGMR